MTSKWISRNIFEQKLSGHYKLRFRRQIKIQFILLAILNFSLGWVGFFSWFFVYEKTIKYSDDFNLKVYLPSGTVFIYVELFHNQNVLKYTKSINYKQLKGKTKNLKLSNLSPYDEKDGKPYYPAGEIAANYFQDVILLEGLEIEQDNIASSRDMKVIGITDYKPDEIEIPMGWSKKTNEGSKALNFNGKPNGLPILNQRFVNWLQISTFLPTKKLWGKVNVENEGDYNLIVKSVANYRKHILIAQSSWLGPRNTYAIFAYMKIAIICIITALLL
ncbi:hypothetical protein NUSPORA_02311 [Nucleospora cyclopteri]